MKNPLHLLNSQGPEPDELTSQLRQQARSRNPEPSPTLRTGVFKALTDWDIRPAQRPILSLLAWGAAAAAVGVLAIALLRHQSSPNQLPSPAPRQLAHNTRPRVGLPTTSLPSNSWALTQHLRENPLETELHNLLRDLSSAPRTIAAILPAPVKRARPDTQLSPEPRAAADPADWAWSTPV